MIGLLASLGLLSSALSVSQQALSLKEATKLAREHSPQLSAVRADASAARANSKAVGAMTLPQLSANGFITRGNDSGILGSSPLVEPPVSMSTVPGSFSDANLMLMVPLHAPKLWAMAASASLQAKAALGDLAESRADLDLRVAEAFFRVLLAKQMVKVAEAKEAAAQELVRTTQVRFDAGSGIAASVRRSEAELASSRRELTSARNDVQKSLLDLQAIIGLDLSNPIDVKDFLAPEDSLTLEAALGQAKQARGMLISARARAEAAGADVRAAEGQRLPQLYGVAMADASNQRGMGGALAGLTVSIPFVDGGRISAEVSQAKAMKAKAAAVLRDTELTVEKEIRQASLDITTSRANLTFAESAVVAAQAAYEVVALRVSAGKSILVEQLDALQALTQARADLAQARFDLELSTARLIRAAGGSK